MQAPIPEPRVPEGEPSADVLGACVNGMPYNDLREKFPALDMWPLLEELMRIGLVSKGNSGKYWQTILGISECARHTGLAFDKKNHDAAQKAKRCTRQLLRYC